MALAAAFAFTLALALQPLAATALTLSAAANATGPVDVEVRLGAGERAGTVTLVDGRVSVAETCTADGLAEFREVLLTPGRHGLQALLTGADGGSWSSAVAAVYAWGAPDKPRFLAPSAGLNVSPVAVRAQAGASTATLALSLNGSVVRTVACRPGASVDLGKARLGRGANVLTVTATSLTGEATATTRSVARTEWPFSTCIVVDKSDYRLYWVKDQQLVASYRIAHGRHNWTPTRTWKVLAKYKTAPHGIYGPRKMRLFARVGRPGHYRYVFTRYAIHGTNQPSLIGTQASHGCIRMYNRDVLKLWPQVKIGTYVVTRP